MGKTIRSARYDEDDEWDNDEPAHVSHVAARALDDRSRWGPPETGCAITDGEDDQ